MLRWNSKQLLRKLQKMLGGNFILPVGPQLKQWNRVNGFVQSRPSGKSSILDPFAISQYKTA